MVISYVGYVPQEIPLKGQKTLTVTLKDDTEMLDEVVVVGYGTMKKSDMTGAISSVKSEDLMKRATTSATEALQGKIAGVSVLKSGGNAGASISVKSVVSKRWEITNHFISSTVIPATSTPSTRRISNPWKS